MAGTEHGELSPAHGFGAGAALQEPARLCTERLSEVGFTLP